FSHLVSLVKYISLRKLANVVGVISRQFKELPSSLEALVYLEGWCFARRCFFYWIAVFNKLTVCYWQYFVVVTALPEFTHRRNFKYFTRHRQLFKVATRNKHSLLLTLKLNCYCFGLA